MIPGELIIRNSEIECNIGRRTDVLTVVNKSDRPIQIGSHFHFFEANKELVFDREKAFGMRLNIASGTGLRFEPGEEKDVMLVEIAGQKTVYGLNGLTCGRVTEAEDRKRAYKAAVQNGFIQGGEEL
ncbi:urease subunit beta/urease subunit gamma/beta [Anaerobacterium chartisolvens]|uniref:Urease subunit beta n=1 Tax=Anaerobacterium chartisolvens TaxID=1297424 RepID=A0A369AYW4_9FIRM|nr:urease subunit beta [Anaerobacterium chartisolvens]RCX13528.1 urease subunit beta/urease subunit gamma/beta [Anaerobacterium chartisolvens]